MECTTATGARQQLYRGVRTNSPFRYLYTNTRSKKHKTSNGSTGRSPTKAHTRIDMKYCKLYLVLHALPVSPTRITTLCCTHCHLVQHVLPVSPTRITTYSDARTASKSNTHYHLVMQVLPVSSTRITTKCCTHCQKSNTHYHQVLHALPPNAERIPIKFNTYFHLVQHVLPPTNHGQSSVKLLCRIIS